MKKTFRTPQIEELNIAATKYETESSIEHDFETYDTTVDPPVLTGWGWKPSGVTNNQGTGDYGDI